MAGITPFLFTSEREIAETGRWFEMYINPETVNISTKPINSKTHTKRAIVTTHWRNDHPELKASGKSGWILKPSILEQVGKEAIRDILDPKKTVDYVKKYGDKLQEDVTNIGKGVKAGNLNFVNTKSANITITPRDFISQLHQIALEDMYYIDENQVEHYNAKKLQIYTKRYPRGIIIDGYFSDFTIPENANDPQAISYDFSFVIETFNDSMQSTNFLKSAVRELVIQNNLRI